MNKNNKIFTPTYELRGLKLLGYRNIQHALCYLCKNGNIKTGKLVAINAEKMILIENNSDAKILIKDAEFKYADGISIVRSLRKKYPCSHISRIAGIDLWKSLMKYAGIYGIPVFLVGSKPNIISMTEKKLRVQWNVNIVGIQNGYFQIKDQQKLFLHIRNSGAKIVTIAMGSPLQEMIMYNCQKFYSDALYMGVGGSYDIFTNKIKRAPKLWQDLGLEWLYRLLLQPNRIIRQLRLLRYFIWHITGKI